MSLKTATIRIDFEDLSGIISINLEIAAIYAEMQNYENALKYFDLAYEIAKKINDEANLAITKLAISVMETERGELNKALINANEALEFTDNSHNFNLLNKVYFQLGLIYYLKNDYNQAQLYFEKVKSRASENNDITYERDALLYLARIFENKGETDKAYSHFKSYADLKERTENTQTAREIERLESRLEIEVKEKENQMLKLNEETYKEVIRKQKALNNALFIIAGLVVILLTFIWFTAYKRRKYNKILLQKNKQIEEHQIKITAQNKEIKQQNNQLIIRNKTLDDLNNEKDSLLSIVAHDLKAPFSRIKGIAELLRLSGLNQEQEQYVQMIRTNSKHGTYLINDLLDVNAIEIDKEKPVPSGINLKSLLENKAADFIVELTNKEMECHIECEPGQDVISDKLYLNRILDNLISNAIKFSELGSEIILRAGKNNKGFWIVVKDFGQGFTKDDQKNMFKKFKKLSSRPTGGESSNGLGLAIVKTLTDRLNGRIELTSEKDKFSEFTLYFTFLEEA
nr:tetratricopeptide repeat-containing sensor histidine kinase [Marivirga aurantiaca]